MDFLPGPRPVQPPSDRALGGTAALMSMRAPGIVIGVGLGGFVDGIVLHQIFQAHHMLSNAGDDRIGLEPLPVTTVDGLETNTVWDGLFHATSWVFVVAGLFWLWQRWRRAGRLGAPWRLLVGSLLAGWGVFNLVEGIIDHHLLAVHHVVEGDHELAWDLGFLALGVALLLGGWRLTEQVRRHHDAGVSAPPS